jgi:hypothetical protein
MMVAINGELSDSAESPKPLLGSKEGGCVIARIDTDCPFFCSWWVYNDDDDDDDDEP